MNKIIYRKLNNFDQIKQSDEIDLSGEPLKRLKNSTNKSCQIQIKVYFRSLEINLFIRKVIQLSNKFKDLKIPQQTQIQIQILIRIQKLIHLYISKE